MQTISGIHYNWSLPIPLDKRRVLRPDPQLPPPFVAAAYLFGASPAVCSTFVAGRQHELRRLSDDTLYLPHATSLRMGRLGYQSDAQSSLAVSYNSLESYGASLQDALTRPYPAYEKIGVRDGDEYKQLATTLLQMENEFYGTIRPKRVIRPGERPLHALRDRGVEYVEVRLMDLDPFETVGINADTMRLLDVYLLQCALTESPPDTPAELDVIIRNKQRVAGRGREPGLTLTRGTEEVSLVEWGTDVLADCAPIATVIDLALGGTAHADAVARARGRLADAEETPSARVLASLREHGNSYVRFMLAQSIAHRDALMALPLAPDVEDRFAAQARESVEAQRRIEAADVVRSRPIARTTSRRSACAPARA
jgi:glutamate--cysteine ligase